MHVYLFCDTPTCLPMRDCPEALLPVRNTPLLAVLLRYLERTGFESAVLLGAGERIRRMLDELHLTMPVRCARSLASLRAEAPTLLLRRLCLPDWDMGELYALCGRAPVRLFDAAGNPLGAELHPTGSALLEPEETAVVRHSQFCRPDSPAAYRALQQLGTGERIGEGVRLGKDARVDEATVIGTDCVIGDGASLTECVLGDGVQIGAGAVLERCVVCRHALVDRGAQAADATVPEDTVLPAQAGIPRRRRLLVQPEDGICWREPRWNTPETALRAGAALSVLAPAVAVGYSKPAGESLAAAAAAGAVSQGVSVWQAGQCALSQLVFAGKMTGCGAFLWVDGSRTIRLLPYGKNGRPLDGARTSRLQRALDAEIAGRIVEHGRLADAAGMRPLWEEECRRLLPEQRPEIRVSCADPLLRQAAERLFSGGSGEQITLTLSEDGTSACAFSVEAGLLRQEQLLLLAAFSVTAQGEPLVLPADFHPAAEQFAAERHVRILRYQAGALSETLYGTQGVCMDGVRLFAHVLRVMAQRHLTLRQAAGLLPRLHTARREVATPLTRQEVERLRRSSPAPFVHVSMPPQGRFVRLKVHADSMEAASELCGVWAERFSRRNE